MPASRVHLVNIEQLKEAIGIEEVCIEELKQQQDKWWVSFNLADKVGNAWGVIVLSDIVQIGGMVNHWSVVMCELAEFSDKCIDDIFILSTDNIFETGESTESPLLLDVLLEWYLSIGIFAPRDSKIPLTKDLMDEYSVKFYQ